MEKLDESSAAPLVVRMIAAPEVSGYERRPIADVADRGLFDDPAFVSLSVLTGELPYVRWRAVREWAQDAHDAELHLVAESVIRAQGYDETDPPLDAERLQVILDLDDPKGWVVALWRDVYADHGQTLEVDMCIEHLTDQHLCWNCGDLGVTERDDRFWCAACMSTTNKEME